MNLPAESGVFTRSDGENAALILRIGLGLVFLIGGWNKLYQLLDPALADIIVAQYMGPSGYINAFFSNYLFNGVTEGVITPWGFLTFLSGFELISGIFLIAGFMVRILALIYAFLLWTFVIALPVATFMPDSLGFTTHTAPAILVQIRDIGLSGLMFALYFLGSGAKSIDRRIFGKLVNNPNPDWEQTGLLIRLSLALPFLIGGFFYGLANIQTYNLAILILLPIALLLIFASGRLSKIGGATVLAAMLWFIAGKLNFDASLIKNLNSFKREFAFAAVGIVLLLYGGGLRFTFPDIARRFMTNFRFAG